MSNILVVGSANADMVIYTDDMPQLGETVLGYGLQYNCGGKGFNQAVAVSKLGGNVSFLGVLGADANGTMLAKAMDEYKIRFEGVISDDMPTGTALITVVGGDNFIVLDPGANVTLTPELIRREAELILAADYIVMQLEIPVETVEAVFQIAKQSKAKIVLNPAPYKPLPEHIYSMVDYLIPNEHEARDLIGVYPDDEDSCRQAVARFKQLGVPCTIITLGEQGCVYNDGDDILFSPAVDSTVVDTTSAGDCFIGALVSRLAQDASLADAVAFANKAASIAVSRPGAAKSIPYAHEIV